MNGFKLWEETPNTICEGGHVYTKTFHIDTYNNFKERLVRVYLPSTYDFSNPKKRFKVLYMLDGKNLFDDYTSFVGEWGVDETVEDFIKKGISDGYIVVGVDAPATDIDRSLEMTPREVKKSEHHGFRGKGYAHKLGKFIFNVLKPEIDKTFFTLKDKENTGVGGSSMGGLMAFYLGMEYPDKIKYCLNFSPAFFLMDEDSLQEYIDTRISEEIPNMYFYVGGVGFERIFVKPTKKVFEYLSYLGYANRMVYLQDKKKEHNEPAWREYFPIALKEIDIDR